MRILLAVLLLLTVLLAVWCAGGYFGTRALQIETKAELSHTRLSGQPLSDADIAVQVSHIGHQGRNWGIAAILAGVSALAALASLLMAIRNKTK